MLKDRTEAVISVQSSKIGVIMGKHKIGGAVCVAMLAALLTSLMLAGSASAKLTGEFTKFQYCPYKTAGVYRCLYSQTIGGEVVLGKKKVPIVNQAVLQGGYTEP